jgi:hypothetical protein
MWFEVAICRGEDVQRLKADFDFVNDFVQEFHPASSNLVFIGKIIS